MTCQYHCASPVASIENNEVRSLVMFLGIIVTHGKHIIIIITIYWVIGQCGIVLRQNIFDKINLFFFSFKYTITYT